MKRRLLTALVVLLTVMLLTLGMAVTAAAASPIIVELPIEVNGTAVVELKADEGTDDAFDGELYVENEGVFRLQYDEPGLYTYKVSQRIGSDEGITYDESVYAVQVFVESDDESVLTPTVVFNIVGETEKDDVISFYNRPRITSCTIDPPVRKIVKSATNKVPVNSSFSFTLTPEHPEDPMPKSNLTAEWDRSTNAMTMTIHGPGEYEFGEILYTLEDLGKTYTYTVTEENNRAPGYTYDKACYTITAAIARDENMDLFVTVTYLDQDGKEVDGPVFTNTYSEPKSSRSINVQTGISDYAGIVTVVISVLLASAVIAYVTVVLRDKRRKDANRD